MAPIDRDTVSDRRARTAPPHPGLRIGSDVGLIRQSTLPAAAQALADAIRIARALGFGASAWQGSSSGWSWRPASLRTWPFLSSIETCDVTVDRSCSTSETMLRRRPNSTGCTPKSTSECQFLLSRSQHPRSPSQRNIADRPRADSPSCVPVPAIRGSLEGPESLTIWDLRVAARPIRIARSRCGIRSRRG